MRAHAGASSEAAHAGRIVDDYWRRARIMSSAEVAVVPSIAVGLFVLRVVFGLYMAAHGAQKLFGWFRGYGLAGTAGHFERLGFRPGHVFAAMAAGTEVVSGLLVALGLFGPIGPALMISVMIVAAGSVHWPQGFFATQNGIELPLLYGVVAFALALIGFGSISLDALLNLGGVWTPAVVGIVLAIGVLGGALHLVIRRPKPAEVTV
jgi:putative oxidoreductase